jgi:tetratricopeptide (TPR) repeat protein
MGTAGESPAAALMAQAYAAQRAGDLDAAKALYDRALAIGPGTPALYNNVGALLVARNEAQKAVPTLKLALQLDASYLNAWVNLGNAYEQLGDHAQAVGAYSQALRLDPGNGATKTNLAQQYIAIGSFGDARRMLDDVIKTSPNLPIAHYRLGQLLEAQHDAAGAIKEFTLFLTLGGAPSQPGFDDRLKAHILTLRNDP